MANFAAEEGGGELGISEAKSDKRATMMMREKRGKEKNKFIKA